MAAVQNPANADTIAALTDLLWVMRRSRLLHQQGTPAMALVVHLAKSGPLRSSDLAGAMNLDQSTVSRHVAHLESAGLVVRQPDPADGRAHLVQVTPEGREQAHTVITSRVHELERIVDDWPDSDRADFARLLARFSSEFEAQLADAPHRTDSPDQSDKKTEESR